MRFRSSVLVPLLLVFGAGPLAAQAWDTPSFLSPGPEDNLGVYLVDPDRGDFGFHGIWRQSGRNLSLGVRAGLMNFDDPIVTVGAEAFSTLVRAGRQFPLDASWTLGLGAMFNDGTTLRIPGGITAGRRFAVENWTFLPYVHPRLGLDIKDAGDDNDTELSFTADLGADLIVGRDWMVRFGISLGDWDAIGVGVAWRTGRGVRVAAE